MFYFHLEDWGCGAAQELRAGSGVRPQEHGRAELGLEVQAIVVWSSARLSPAWRFHRTPTSNVGRTLGIPSPARQCRSRPSLQHARH